MAFADASYGELELTAGVLEGKEEVLIGPVAKELAEHAQLGAVLFPEFADLFGVVGLGLGWVGLSCRGCRGAMMPSASPVTSPTWWCGRRCAGCECGRHVCGCVM